MKILPSKFLPWLCIWTLLILSGILDSARAAGPASPPNVIIILADDMGWGDPGCYNPESKFPTPHLDALATGGMRFTDAHTPSSVCTPTRYTLLTGRYCWRTRLKSGVLDGFSPPLIEADRPTIASYLKQKGYATACLGKWHLGMQWTRKDGTPEDVDREGKFRGGETIDFATPITGGPTANGFDSYFGISASLDMPPYCWIENDHVWPGPPDAVHEEIPDTIFLNGGTGVSRSDFERDQVLPELKKRTVAWIGEHQEKHPEQPFFMYLPLNSPHLPVVPSDAFRGKSGAGDYGDFVVETDDFAGAVMAALEQHGLTENTLVLFTSDNGGLWHRWEPQEADDLAHYKPTPRGKYNWEHGHQSNADWRGTKADIWEGGHRVPFIIQWPAAVRAGSVSDQPVELTDVFATISAIFGDPNPADAAPDSYSFLRELKSEPLGGSEISRPFLVHHSLRGMFSIREGDWKFVEARGSGGFSTPRSIDAKPGEADGQLYHISEDPQETRNLYLAEPRRAAAMREDLEAVKTGEGLKQ